MEKCKALFMKDWFFIPICMLICCGVMGGVHLYMEYNVGYMHTLVGGQLLKSGDFTTAAGYGGGFLIARILEGPLVGILDIGGSIMAGVGVGVAGMLYAMGFGFLFDNVFLSLLAGAGVGFIIGSIVMGVRYIVPEGVQTGGSDIMMGVGHQLASWMGPLFLISAWSASIPIGMCGAIGGVLFYMKGKNYIGGIIIGMFIAAFIWTV